MELRVLDGQVFALWLTDDADESIVFSGIARWNGQSLFLERRGAPNFEVRPEWYARIAPVSDQQSREVLSGASYCLRLKVGSLDTSDEESYEFTGLQWPNHSAASNDE